jgi:hypothetical protein
LATRRSEEDRSPRGTWVIPGDTNAPRFSRPSPATYPRIKPESLRTFLVTWGTKESAVQKVIELSVGCRHSPRFPPDHARGLLKLTDRAKTRGTRFPACSFRPASRYLDVMTKQTTVRLPEDLAKEAEAVARVNGISVNALIIESLSAEIARVRADTEFTTRVSKLLKRDKELLNRLAR